MNWLLLVIVAILAGNIVWGYKKGFLRVAYSLVEWILVLVFVIWASPHVADYVLEHTAISDRIQEQCVTQMRETVKTNAQNAIKEKIEESAENKKDSLDDIKREQLDGQLASLGIQLPSTLSNSLIDSLSETLQEKLLQAAESTGEAADRILENSGVYQQLSKNIAEMTVRGLSYLATFVFALILFGLIDHALKIVDKIPLLSGINNLIGLMAGLIKGLLLVWVFFAVVAAGAGTEWGRLLTAMIQESPFLAWLYSNNFVLTLLLHFMK